LSSSDTISDINALITHDKELHDKLSEKIQFITSKIIYSYETYDVKSEDGEYIKKNIYLYEYLIMYVVYSLIDAIAPNGNGNIFDISHISNISTTTDTVLQQRLMIVFDIGKYILETMVKKVISNSYNSVDISSVNEDLREKREEINKQILKEEEEKAKIQRDSVTAVSASGATNIDLSLGNSFVVTMNATATFSFINPPSGTDITSFTIITVNSAGGYAISWPASVTWSGGATPTRTTTSAKQDAYTFFTRDGGTTYVGSLAITNY
jgi:hypothetical protein